MPGCKGRAVLWKRHLLCNSHRLYLPRVVTFNRAFIPGFLLSAAFRLFGLSAPVIRTNNERARFQVLLQQIWTAALRTRFGDRPVCRREPALGIIGTTVEEISATRLLLCQVAGLALRTLHANIVLLDPLAFGIAAAGDELSEAAMAQQQVAPALRTFLVKRNVGDLLGLVQAARSLAVRISGAGHKLAESPALQHHGPAAVLAILFLRRLLEIGRVEVRQ